MAAVANRAASESPIGFFSRSLGLIRTLSTSATQIPTSSSASSSFSSSAAAAATDGADPKKTDRRKKKKNLFEVTQFLPNWGIGYKMAKSHWRDVSYEITKINLYKDGRHGKAWGIRHKAGIAVADSPIKISGVNKRGWKYFPEANKKKGTEEAKKGEEPNPA